MDGEVFLKGVGWETLTQPGSYLSCPSVWPDLLPTIPEVGWGWGHTGDCPLMCCHKQPRSQPHFLGPLAILGGGAVVDKEG